jgi:hypothetical protein
MNSGMVEPKDDFPHPVPPQAFMTWKENWVWPAVDTANRVAILFHFSLRPAHGEGIFTAKFCIDGWEHRYVGRSPVPADLTQFVPVRNEKITFEVVEPAERFRLRYASDELDADITYIARFPAWDFDDGVLAPGDSILGDRGRTVFHFHHYEQSLRHEGTITVKTGPHAGRTIAVSGYANRDHSWGWREDLTFRHHHWLCASFADRFVEGTVMNETCYPHGDKFGGWISTAAGNDGVIAVDASDAYWLAPNAPLPQLDRDVRYVVRTEGGQTATVTAHIASDYGRLYLNARNKDRTEVYQDVQIFCDMTLEETGERGSGVLELGKFYDGPDAAEVTARSASRVPA